MLLFWQVSEDRQDDLMYSRDGTSRSCQPIRTWGGIGVKRAYRVDAELPPTPSSPLTLLLRLTRFLSPLQVPRAPRRSVSLLPS